MTAEQRAKICKRMLWIIPGMILAIIGDYCMGLEPKDSTAISFMISSGWLTIADWRIALSNIGGLIGTVFYAIAALSFIDFLKVKLSQCSDKWGRRFLRLYIAGLYWGCMVFIYFHLACGTLIHNYNVIYDAVQGDTARAVAAWNRSYAVQAIPYWVSFVVLGIASSGGWIALAGAIALGPRIGKYHANGKPNPIPGHSLVLGTLGVFLLWIGWFGFNPGSYTAGIGSIGRVAMTTNLAACAGTIAALVTAWAIMGKPDLTMALNGSLAGLVAITAPCDLVTANAAIVIGLVAGVLVVFSVFALDKVHVDDPVGAGATAIWAFGMGAGIFFALKKLGILRVSPKTELKGLDLVEHGQDAYASFQFFSNT